MNDENTNTAEKKPSPSDIARGGRTVICERVDGTSVSVFVRQVKPSELDAYAMAMFQGSQMDLLCLTASVEGQKATKESLDELTPDSYTALCEEEERQNFSHGQKHLKRLMERTKERMAMLRSIQPKAVSALEKAIEKEAASAVTSQRFSATAPQAAFTGES